MNSIAIGSLNGDIEAQLLGFGLGEFTDFLINQGVCVCVLVLPGSVYLDESMASVHHETPATCLGVREG